MAGLVEGLRKCIRVMDKCGIQERTFPQQKKPVNRSPPQMEVYSTDHTSSTGATLILADHQKRNKCEFCLGNHKAVECVKDGIVHDREAFITEELEKKLRSRKTKKKVCQRFEGLNKNVQELSTVSHVVQLTSLDGIYKDAPGHYHGWKPIPSLVKES